VACRNTKAAISLKRVKIEEKLLWTAYRKSQTFFRTVPSRPPTAFPSPRLGVRNPTPKLQSLLSQERLQIRTANLADTFTGPSEHKPIKKFGEMGAWAYPGTVEIFSQPPIISGTGKATNFHFVRTFLVSIGTKACYKFREK